MNIDSSKTIEKYEKILENDPSSSSFVFLAQILYRQKDFDRAVGVLLSGLRYNKNNITGRFLLGKIYYERWMIELAKKELETVFGLAPDNLAAGTMLVQIYRSEENFEKALEVLEHINEFHPSETSIIDEINELSQREKPLAHWENFSAPNRDYRKDEILAERKLLTETMADIYFKQGDYDKGISVLREILENDPGNSSVRKKMDDERIRQLNKSAGLTNEE